MPNPYLPRAQVHAWSDDIGAQQTAHQGALNRLLQQQRRLTRFLEENQKQLEPTTAGIALYLYGVLARIFDLAGGQLRAVGWDQVREAEARIRTVVGDLLPVDDGFAERVRAVPWRAQPHLLDEAMFALFERPAQGEEEEQLDQAELAKVFLLMWVAIEALDACWRPPKGFTGETTYTHVHIEHEPREA